jgi:hypothetical protein
MPTRVPDTAGPGVAAMATGITPHTIGITPHTTGITTNLGTFTVSIPVFMGGYSTMCPRYGLLLHPTSA